MAKRLLRPDKHKAALGARQGDELRAQAVAEAYDLRRVRPPADRQEPDRERDQAEEIGAGIGAG